MYAIIIIVTVKKNYLALNLKEVFNNLINLWVEEEANIYVLN